MLLAFSAKADELDVLMLSLTFGNVEVQKYVFFSLFFFLDCPVLFFSSKLGFWLGVVVIFWGKVRGLIERQQTAV